MLAAVGPALIVVIDASVALKWFFSDREDEEHVNNALEILRCIDSGQVRMVQPPHFLAEMAAVLAREKPEEARADLADLQRLLWEVSEGPGIYATAVELSIQLDQHLFDTLYHATALETDGATLVTADSRYYANAKGIGRIMRVDEFRLAD